MTTHHINDLGEAIHSWHDRVGGYPWTVIGVAPRLSDVEAGEEFGDWNWFCYTAGAGREELWAPCQSVEGRGGGNELVAGILNHLAVAWQMDLVTYGDQVTFPLGTSDGVDVDTEWWIGWEREPAERRQCFVDKPEWCVPILWSSGLGWPE